jgi:3'-phosphoadenosine 5'-phosphosulfate sulfotransferase (PAPS reductase)/FAD synthetase
MNKLSHTQELIKRGAEAFPRGMICWSGGKNSMVLLHIVREMGMNLPLIFFKEPW